MNIKKIGLSLLLAAASVAAVAGEGSGFYAGVAGNRVHVDDLCSNAQTSGNSGCDQNDYTLGAFGGYNVNETYSVELGYNDLGNFSYGPYHVDGDAWDVAGLAKMPVFDGAWSIYARAGWAMTSVSTNVPGGDSDSSDWVAGAGAEIPVMDQVNVRLDWRMYNDVGDGSASSDVSAWSLAGVYNF